MTDEELDLEADRILDSPEFQRAYVDAIDRFNKVVVESPATMESVTATPMAMIAVASYVMATVAGVLNPEDAVEQVAAAGRTAMMDELKRIKAESN